MSVHDRPRRRSETDVEREDARDFVPLIRRVMAQRSISVTVLAQAADVGRSRLGLLLHNNPAKRHAMTLGEFQRILRALDLSIIEAAIQSETFDGSELSESGRYRTLITMLCDTFRSLPRSVISALEDIDGIDGSEVRLEWAAPIERALTKRLTDEISAVVRRRNSFGLSEEFRF